MWLLYISIGLVVAAMQWVAERRSVRSILRLFILCSEIVIVFFGFAVFGSPATLGGSEEWLQESALFVTMIAGMAARYVTKAIEDRRAKLMKWREAGSLGVRPGIEFDRWEFAYPLFVSAITFGALESQVESGTLTLQNVLISFQTGFFWQTVLASRT